MRVSFRSWRWLLPAMAALAWTPAWVAAQQPLNGVQLAEPVPAGIDTAPPAADEPLRDSVADEPPLGTRTALDAEPPLTADDNLDANVSDDAGQSGVVEVIKERYPSGGVKVEREVIQDAEGNYVMHGAWRAYDEQGRLVIDGRHDRNMKSGLWRRFYRGDDAPLLATAPYKSFTPPFISSATFHAGQLHGKWTMTDSKQRKVHEIEFCNGERHGMATWHYATGSIMLQAHYEDGRVNGDVIQFAPDSSIAAKEKYQNGRKLAAKIDYHDDAKQSKKSEVMYLHAVLVVKTPDHWDSGTLAVFETRGQDERHGPFTTWHSNGQLARQGEFRYNLPVGKINYWYASGQKQLEGMYVDGKQQGVWTWWHVNGQKSIAGEYHDGTPVGIWTWWKETGKVAQKADLSNERPTLIPTNESPTDLREARVEPIEPSLPAR